MRVQCFQIPLDSLNPHESVACTRSFLTDGRQHYIVTPNPEMVMLAKSDRVFRQALRNADLSLIDGVGLALALRFLGYGRVQRTTGVDWLTLFFRAVPPGTKFFFLGGLRGVAAQAAANARAEWKVIICGTAEPPQGTYESSNALCVVDGDHHRATMQAIQTSEPDVLVVALGHGQQEKWLATFLPECPTVKVAIGVGGALDYLSGHARRAPIVLRRFGLEWLWRFVHEPQRCGRIWTATIAFPAEAVRWWFSMHFMYRESVVGCIVNGRGEVLIVQRLDNPGHWQFPQGGREPGETAYEAVKREMREELGLTQLNLMGQSRPNVYRYTWVQTHEKISVREERRRYGYRGQRQTVFYLRFTGSNDTINLDRKEHIAWRWVPADNLLASLHPVRQALGRIALNGLRKYTNEQLSDRTPRPYGER